ncbi:MAG: immunity 17 family protein [Gemmataceae bacterium]
MSESVLGVLFCAIGLFSIVSALGDWDWFMNHWRARLFVQLFGRNGARVFYVILGVAIFGLGILFSTGIIRR